MARSYCVPAVLRSLRPHRSSVSAAQGRARLRSPPRRPRKPSASDKSRASKSKEKEKDKELTREQARAQGKNSATPALAAARPATPQGPRPGAVPGGDRAGQGARAVPQAGLEDGGRGAARLASRSTPARPRCSNACAVTSRSASAASSPSRPSPRPPEEHYQIGILRLNQGELDDSIAHLTKALALKERTEAAHYALACAHALKSDTTHTLKNLKLAIEMNPENRIHALRRFPISSGWRDDAEFTELVGARSRG